MSVQPPTILVAGALANKPYQGGEAWVRLSWMLGLRKLGCRVHFVEGDHSPDPGGARYFDEVVRRFELQSDATLLRVDEAPGATLLDALDRADALLNISGHLTRRDILQRVRHNRVFIDIDPGFTQFWHAQGNAGANLAGHDRYYTIGENVGSPACTIPAGGFEWRAIRQPVVLEHWPVIPPRKFDRFTTVANWRGSYGVIHHAGQTYGLKVHEFRKFIELPRRSGKRFEIALTIHPGDAKDRDALLAAGWVLTDPRAAASSPEAFRNYVQNASAEFSVAQGIYGQTHSGWFSDRSVRYLASGRPVLVQDTGFGRHVPTGEGLIAFRTMDEAIDGAARIVRDYPRHCAAARRIAEEYFDSDKVLSRLLSELGIDVPS